MTISELITKATHHFDASRSEIMSDAKQRRIVRARQAVAWVASQRGSSLSAIGRVMNRDHSTISYQIAEANRLRECDAEFMDRVDLMVGSR